MMSERSKSWPWILFGLLILGVVIMLAMGISSAAYGAGPVSVPATSTPGSLGDYFDLGDINGGYHTTMGDGYADLYAHIGGEHKITNSQISLYPDYWYNYDNQGRVISKTLLEYRVTAYISGNITGSLDDDDTGSQNDANQFNARGISFSQNSWLGVYRSYYDYDQFGNGIGDYDLFSQAGTSMTLQNFGPTRATGRYNESTWPGGDGGFGYGAIAASAGGPTSDPTTYFAYEVSWYGNFLPGTVTAGFVAPAMGTSVGAVPEPSTFALMVVGGIGLGFTFWRKRRR